MFASLTRMLGSLGGFIEGGGSTRASEDTQLAACALLLELAHADAEFSPPERVHIERAVRRQFGMGPAESEKLLDLAARLRHDTVEVAQLTSQVTARYSGAQIAVLAEIMWTLIHSDGHVASEERYLLRKIYFFLRCESAHAI